ncbi:MAG: 16S rRNA (cytidine(1402)-2'-O)-methyltransferase [Candidatus Neoclostridium sp.]
MLYVVATPIGNADEITFRAVETLKAADVILCEDTRHSRPLLARYGVEKPLISYQKFNERSRCGEIIDRLKKGESVAVISDAGMPTVSDPGHVLLDEVIASGLEYTVISGPCAAINALVLSGLSTEKFLFIGFLPEKKADKDAVIARYRDVDATLIFYLPLSDVDRIIEYLSVALGDRKCALIREMTKKFEQVVRGTLCSLPEFTHKGEFVLVVEGEKEQNKELNALSIAEHVDFYVRSGVDKKEAIKKVARDRGVAKSEIYAETIGKK